MSALPGMEDTIVAVATSPGRGALAVVRLSGPRAHGIARAIAHPWPDARRATRVDLVRRDGTKIDEAVLVRYDAPASFTGENAAELTTHGGLVVPAAVLEALIEAGARPAEPGEFTRRAVLNGKLDLVQAEAVAALVDARSRAAHRLAIDQLDGGLSARIEALRRDVLQLEALLAYDIDFPEEDDGPIDRRRIGAAAADLVAALELLARTAPRGELAREGALVVLAGAPNVGKSSLFNALLGRERAIVTPVPGTTRDALEAVLDHPRWPLRLVDTAGLRDTDDPVELRGIEVSSRYLASAAVVVACGDSAGAVERAAAVIASHASAPIVRARTKADLGVPDAATNDVTVSAATGAGLADLVAGIEAALDGSLTPVEANTPVVATARQRERVESALSEARAFAEAWNENALPATVAATHLRQAATLLGDVIGVVRVDDVLDELFRRFCVGK